MTLMQGAHGRHQRDTRAGLAPDSGLRTQVHNCLYDGRD